MGNPEAADEYWVECDGVIGCWYRDLDFYRTPSLLGWPADAVYRHSIRGNYAWSRIFYRGYLQRCSLVLSLENSDGDPWERHSRESGNPGGSTTGQCYISRDARLRGHDEPLSLKITWTD